MFGLTRNFLAFVFDWLAGADPCEKSDLIVALAGRESRKVYALKLFSEGKSRELIVSVGRYEVRRFVGLLWPTPVDLVQTASRIPPRRRHFFVKYASGATEVRPIRTRYLGTWSEIEALATLLGPRTDLRSLTVVTSSPHLRRVRLCCHSLLPSEVCFCLLAVPDDGPSLHRDSWWRDRKSRHMVLCEFTKLLLYWSLLQVQRLVRRPILSSLLC
jgi:hypothetical protein